MRTFSERIADLMADMIIGKATKEEMERLIKFSMAVMDIEREYNIGQLREKYSSNEEKIEK